jgi:uncharacterized membrane protein
MSSGVGIRPAAGHSGVLHFIIRSPVVVWITGSLSRGSLTGVVEGVAGSLTHMFFSLALSACWTAEEEIGIS